MDGFRPFRPEGACYALQASNATPSGATFVLPVGQGDATFMIDNVSGPRAFLGFGMTSDAAVANARVPAPGANPVNCLPLAGGTVQTFTFAGTGMFVAARTDGGAGTIFLTLGDGV